MKHDLKTSMIEVKELRPCDFCGGPIAPCFRVVESKFAVIAQGARQVLGLNVMGLPPEVALVMGPSDGAEVLEENITKLFCCNHCWGKSLPIAEKIELRNEKDEAIEELRK